MSDQHFVISVSLYVSPPLVNDVIACVNTTPKINPPKAMNTKLVMIKVQLFLSKRDGSDRKAHINRHNPGNIKMNTAARLPSNLITSPMLGMTRANIKDRTNQIVTHTYRTISSYKIFKVTSYSILSNFR